MSAQPRSPTAPVRRNRLRPVLWGGAAGLLLLPAIAMRLEVEGVDWNAADFLVMGAMLGIACGLYELATRRSGDLFYRAGAGAAVATAFLTVWVNLAVGMFGSGTDPVNLVFAVAPLVAGAGTLLARFRARGLARTMVAAAVAQLLAVGVAVLVGPTSGPDDPSGPSLALEAVLSAYFALPWLASALLFGLAAVEMPSRQTS